MNYQQIKTFLVKKSCQILINENEFELNSNIKFQCIENHYNEMNLEAFENRISPNKQKYLKSLCYSCNTNLHCQEQENNLKNFLKEMNLEFIKLENLQTGPIVIYRCKCGNLSQTHLHNLIRKNKDSCCPKCQNNKNKNNMKQIREYFSQNGCILLTTENEYKNNKQKLNYQCSCGNKSQIVYSSFKRGRRCMKCRYKK